MWGSGNYVAVADKIAGSGELLVDRAGHRAGAAGCSTSPAGPGNATVPAARSGPASHRPRLLRGAAPEVGAGAAADAGVEVEWVEADAQAAALPGRLLRPRAVDVRAHVRPRPRADGGGAAARVPAGRRGSRLACWTPEGKIGAMFGALGELGPPPPDGFQSPLLWGTEEHVRRLLGDRVRFERHEVEWRDASIDAYAEFM